MSKPLVSIILPVYNAQNHIARCLESICAQSWQNRYMSGYLSFKR